MLSQHALFDHIEIQQLNYRYADCIDSRRFDELVDVFTPDAHIDYSVYGGAVGRTEAIIAFLKKWLAHCAPHGRKMLDVQRARFHVVPEIGRSP